MAKYKDKRLNEEVSTGGAVEGTAVLSTGETGGTKFLREDGDGTCSWQTAGGSFAGTMDDITDGTTYVKTENNLTDALVSTIGTALQSQTSHADVLVDGDIGSSVQGYNANTVIDASYVHTDVNFTSAKDSKLSGIASGAEVNVNADWNATSGDAQILNKPSIPTSPTVATGAEVDTGTDNTKMVTPKAMEDSAYTKLALGETSGTAYRGDRGKTAYDHSQTTHAPTNADNTETALLNNGAEINSLADGDRIPIMQLFEGEPNAVGYIQYQNLLIQLRSYFDNIYTPL